MISKILSRFFSSSPCNPFSAFHHVLSGSHGHADLKVLIHPQGSKNSYIETRGWGECMLHLGLLGLLEVLLVDPNVMSVEGSQHNTSLSFSSPMLPAPCPVISISTQRTTDKLIHNGGDVPTFISFIQLPSAANR